MGRPKPNPPFVSSLLLAFLTLSTLADDSSIMKELAMAISPTPPNWSAPDPCNWVGVVCDNSKRVTSISLFKLSLSGKLPPDLNQLTQLQKLVLQGNQFSGPMPSFANLSNLQSISLDHNNFTSVPPLCFSGLTSLQSLSLTFNLDLEPWGFPQELVESESLIEIDAANVSFTGVLPDIFDKFISLQDLRLSYNNFTGPLPTSLANSGVKNLWLNTQAVGLSGGIDLLATMSQLSQVWLHSNQFSGPIPDLSNCTSLFDLQLRDNELTGIVPPSLSSQPALLNVSLANNKLQGPVPEFRKNVKVTLGSTNNFCNSVPGPCDPQVTTLLEIAGAMGYPMSLAESWKGNDVCQDWTFVTCGGQGKNVTVINFSKQNFGGTISPAFMNLPSLTKLLLNDNNLTGAIPDGLTVLSGLQLLDVSNNNLTGKEPKFSPKVTVKTTGNSLLDLDTTAAGDRGGNLTSGTSGSSPEGSPPAGKQNGPFPPWLIAAIIIAAVVFIAVICMVCYKYCTRGHTMKFGRVQNGNGKEIESIASASGHMNGASGVGNELNSQNSDASDVLLLQGGNVAISIQVLRQVTNTFSPENILGRGGFGIVYKGVLHDGTQIAVKRMESSLMSTKGLKEFQAEIAVLTKVRHRHLVALLGFCTSDNERLLVYEYMPQGTLGQHLFDWRVNKKSPLTWKQRVTIALDVARGVEYLHTLAQESFIHRDLKASNILLGDDMRAKVSDFGLVKSAPSGKQSIETRLAGTFGYLAPEYAVTGKVSTKVDVYAFGAVLMELITGRPALDDSLPDDESHLVTWFRRVMGSVNGTRKAIDPELEPADEIFSDITRVVELAGHCTSREAGQRPDMSHAVNVLGPLVEQWTPSEEVEADLGINLHLSLPEALERWRSNEGSSTMNYGGMMNFNDTHSSIPPNDRNTFRSTGGR